MNNLISRQAAIDALGEEPEVWVEEDDYARGLSNQWRYDVTALKAVPSAQPEIIRCKDCKRYGQDNCFIKIQMLWELKPDDFCSQAERREE